MRATEWIASRGHWSRRGLAFVAGAVMTAGHAPIDVPWALFVDVPILALLVASAPTWRAAAGLGWFAGFGYFVTGLHWIGYAFLVDPDRFAWLLPLGTAALPAGLALFWCMAFGLARRFWPSHVVGGIIWLSAIWTLAEFARGNILTGLPWALPGYVWVETPVMQMAAFVGPYAVTLGTLIICTLPAVFLSLSGRWRVMGLILPALIVGLSWVAGVSRSPAETAYKADAPVIRVVQPNAPQALKWHPDHWQRYYLRALTATAATPDAALGPADIVIWPEATLRLVPELNGEEMIRIAEAGGDAHVLFGALFGEVQGNDIQWANAMVTLSPDGEIRDLYRKHHLVPFGEYLPMEPLFTALGLSQFAITGNLRRGSGPQTVRIPGLPAYSPLICYEAIFPGAVVGDTRPDWLLQPTNDAWFGPFAGPRQHLAQARIRAIEQGLPMVRAANTGISAVIDPHGRIITALPLDTDGYADARLPSALPPTLYAQLGDWPFWAMILLCLGASQLFRSGQGRSIG